MVGRGLRLSSGKSDCLVLDFANCIDEHGPIDLLGGDKIVLAVCGSCRESFSRAIRSCPVCGWVIPPREVERMEALEKERRMHGVKVSSKSILSNEPETLTVDTIYVARHKKDGSPDSVRLQFRCGIRMFRMWLCLDHPGQAGKIAHSWWRRFMGASLQPPTVNMVLSDLFVSQSLLSAIRTITVKKNGKWFEIVDYNKEVT
jgi:DNA repair protein RadD